MRVISLPACDFTARRLLRRQISLSGFSFSALLHLASSPNTLRKTRMRGMKIELSKIANSFCQNILKN
jgi:hypothetical protein